MILAQLEADTVSLDAISAGGGGMTHEWDLGSGDWFLRRAFELLAGFADRHGLELSEIRSEN